MQLKTEFIRLTATTRLYQQNRPIVGLTGGIATGKSTVADLLASSGFGIIGADILVHEIYKQETTLDLVQQLAPTVIEMKDHNRSINFKLLRQIFFKDHAVKDRILNHIYPRMEEQFNLAAKKLKQDVLIYDVPLLFERKLDSLIDLSVCVYAPKEIQRKRLAARDGSPSDVINAILEQQMDIEDKRRRADRVINNSGSLDSLEKAVKQFIQEIFV